MVRKILIVTSYFAPAWSYGGPPKVLYVLAKELARRDVEVTVITTDVFDEKRNIKLIEKLEGINIVRLKTVSNLIAYRAKIFFVPNLLNKVKKIIDQNEFILFSDLRAVINWQLYTYVKNKKIPYAVFPFGQTMTESGIKSLIKRLFDFLWTQDFIEHAAFILVQTNHEREQLRQYFHIPFSKIQFLPLPVEKKRRCTPKKELTEFRKKWNIQADDNLLLFVGRLNYLKGVDILISAVKPLINKMSNLKLMIVGRDDGEENTLRSSVPSVFKKNIIFTGPLYGEEVFNAYQTASCFSIIPRFYEETSTASLEAMSWGVPVVVNKQVEIPFLKNYKAGFIVENEPDSISSAIYKIISASPNKKKIMSREAIRCIKDHFLVENVASHLLQIMQKFKKV